jgi:hypothetical protein
MTHPVLLLVKKSSSTDDRYCPSLSAPPAMTTTFMKIGIKIIKNKLFS